MTSFCPFGKNTDLSKMLTRRAFGLVPAGRLQLIVGVVGSAGFAVIVTLEGKGTGADGMIETEGNCAIATSVPLVNLTCHDPLVGGRLKGVRVAQKFASTVKGLNGETDVRKVGFAEPVGVKSP